MKKRTRDARAVADGDVSALLLRIGMVVRVTGLGRSTIYRLVASDEFPAPVRLTTRAVAWRRADLERWTNAVQSATDTRHVSSLVGASRTLATED
jgi:prophage regulatory protein